MASWTYGSIAIQIGDPPCDYELIPIVLIGGPVDGLEREAVANFDAILVFRCWPDTGAIDANVDYFYTPTRQRKTDGRLICRYVGRKAKT